MNAWHRYFIWPIASRKCPCLNSIYLTPGFRRRVCMLGLMMQAVGGQSGLHFSLKLEHLRLLEHFGAAQRSFNKCHGFGAAQRNSEESYQIGAADAPWFTESLAEFYSCLFSFFYCGGELICIFQVNIVILVIMSTNSKFVKDVEQLSAEVKHTLRESRSYANHAQANVH